MKANKSTDLTVKDLSQNSIADLVNDACNDRIMVLNNQGEVILWNLRNEIATGMQKKDVVGKQFTKLFPEADKFPEIGKGIKLALSGKSHFVPFDKGGYESGHFENHFIPMKKENGEVIGVLNIKHDVSHQVKIESELKALNKSLAHKNKQLKERNKELVWLAYAASHGLKQPLRKIYTFIEVLVDKEFRKLSEEGKSYFKRIQSSVQRMGLLTDDLYDYATLDTNTAAFKKVDLNDIIKKVKMNVKEQIAEKGAIIETEKLPVINGDKGLLIKLFQELVTNALKFQKNAAVPLVNIKVMMPTIKELKKAEHPDRNYVKIVVNDNGIGFANEDTERVFEVFKKLNSDKYAGTGMGLAICKKIIELHDGFITASAEMGTGSSFSIFLPV